MSPIERPNFVEAYKAVEVPEPLVSMDAIDPRVHEVSEQFFSNVQNSLDLSGHTLATFFEREDKMLVTPSALEKETKASDDYIHLFRRRGGQALASVMYHRDDFNYQIAQFAKFQLLPSTIKDIQEFQRIERIIHGIE